MSNFNWSYNPNDYSATNSDLLEEGKYGVRVIKAKQTVAKNGTEGLEISLEVCGQGNKLKHCLHLYHPIIRRRIHHLLF